MKKKAIHKRHIIYVGAIDHINHWKVFAALCGATTLSWRKTVAYHWKEVTCKKCLKMRKK